MRRSSFSHFFALPEDVIRTLLVDWIPIEDIARLDSATCHEENRSTLLQLLHSNDTMLDCRSIDVDDGMIGWIKRKNLHLQGSLLLKSSIADAGLISIGQSCANLQKLDLSECSNVTDAGLISIGQGCANLQEE